MTCVAILSIGFRVFLRRGFGKAESFGLSLMEIGTGAGTFIISSSIRDVASPSSGNAVCFKISVAGVCYPHSCRLQYCSESPLPRLIFMLVPDEMSDILKVKAISLFTGDTIARTRCDADADGDGDGDGCVPSRSGCSDSDSGRARDTRST